VFWLMGLATKSAKRLSDIVEAKLEAIMKRSGRLLIGFLQHLIKQDVDYAWRKREMQAVAADQADATRSERELEDMEGRMVCVDGGEQAIRVNRMGSGFFGELVGAAGAIPHGELLKLVRAGRVGPWKAGSCGKNDTPVCEDRKASNLEALRGIRALVGVRRGTA
jgi:hypothetical protein